jgi:hypothetical protein
MTNPVETIGRGLDAHERAKNAPGTFKLAALAAAPSTIAEISEITVQAAKARDRLHKMRAESVDAVQKHRAKITAEYADLGMVEHESGRGRLDTLGADRRHKMIEGSVKNFRKTLNAETAEERTRLLAEQRESKATLDLVRQSYASPEAILMLDTLGTEKRSNYFRDLERAGPTELENAMRRATQTNDKDLAAACCVRLDSIGKEGRKLVRFSKTNIAEVVAGDSFMKATEVFGLADLAFAQSELAEQEISTGKGLNANQKMRIGLMRHELETKIGKKLDADGHVINEDGSPKGETFEDRLDRLYPGGPLPEGYTLVGEDGKDEANAD